MNQYVEILDIIDRSGSMSGMREEAISGCNEFIRDQQKLPGKAIYTQVQFDDQYQVLYDAVPLEEVNLLTTDTFVPRGTTALMDAIGKAIHDLGKRIKDMDEPDRPDKIIVAITTDGYENASSEYNANTISKIIKDQTDTYNWEFFFLGAGLDTAAVAASINIKPTHTIRYDATGAGVTSAYTQKSAMVYASRVASAQPSDPKTTTST